MKTAVSLPEHLFYKAEQLARQRGVSRSELYRRALESYLEQQYSKEVLLENLNSVYAEVDSSVDPVMRELAKRTLLRIEWED